MRHFFSCRDQKVSWPVTRRSQRVPMNAFISELYHVKTHVPLSVRPFFNADNKPEYVGCPTFKTFIQTAPATPSRHNCLSHACMMPNTVSFPAALSPTTKAEQRWPGNHHVLSVTGTACNVTSRSGPMWRKERLPWNTA